MQNHKRKKVDCASHIGCRGGDHLLAKSFGDVATGKKPVPGFHTSIRVESGHAAVVNIYCSDKAYVHSVVRMTNPPCKLANGLVIWSLRSPNAPTWPNLQKKISGDQTWIHPRNLSRLPETGTSSPSVPSFSAAPPGARKILTRRASWRRAWGSGWRLASNLSMKACDWFQRHVSVTVCLSRNSIRWGLGKRGVRWWDTPHLLSLASKVIGSCLRSKYDQKGFVTVLCIYSHDCECNLTQRRPISGEAKSTELWVAMNRSSMSRCSLTWLDCRKLSLFPKPWLRLVIICSKLLET